MIIQVMVQKVDDMRPLVKALRDAGWHIDWEDTNRLSSQNPAILKGVKSYLRAKV